MKLHLITGGAGFVAVNLTRRLLQEGSAVLALDDLSRGRRELVAEFDSNPSFIFRQVDCSDLEALSAAIQEVGAPVAHVWHLAANSDIPAGVTDPRIDRDRTFLTTFAVLEAMRRHEIPELHFASSSAIYGDLGEREIHEDIGPLQPISNYGAMKLASEVQIRAAVEAFLPRADIFRFPNVIGVPATHGVIFDFIRKLKATPDQLQVLGNGTQQKAYLHVDDLIDAMLHVSRIEGRYNVFNIGPKDDGVTVRMIAQTVRDRVSPKAEIVFGEGNRGWVGDVPRFRYSTQRLAASGWSPQLDSTQAMVRAVDEIAREELAE
ncbi:SDR family NAD(P)-dependent oxidoreductase [Acidovorax cavernicola]|uniref:SDR family NAD(P)-dependent oxidoreductase n=1 Tax=Acidovorax cavernicola TaxID=1675792 RepID=A0A9X8D143_9BURK|nr:SDR family NAD(P)-dependent oxidoreductase [Acidovorax cavernicola]RIX75355.1 SDR family NAD(P)-dependent oxidoreductase [Acidovorax cavernicola]